jgi:hypothetical protein
MAVFAGMNFACMAVMPALSPSYRKLNAQDQGEWITRCSSTVNAFVTGFLCLYTLLTDAHVWADGVWYRPHFTMYAIAIAAGYFYVDFAFITYYRIPPLLPIITHHCKLSSNRITRHPPHPPSVSPHLALHLTQSEPTLPLRFDSAGRLGLYWRPRADRPVSALRLAAAAD